ncbi:unnamed protein product [Prunus armeniaca]
MVRLKFPITTFSLCSQSNHAPKTRSLMPLMFSKFDSTSSLTEVAANHPIVNRWKSYFSQIYYECGGGCGRDGASSGGGDKVRLGSWMSLIVPLKLI